MLGNLSRYSLFHGLKKTLGIGGSVSQGAEDVETGPTVGGGDGATGSSSSSVQGQALLSKGLIPVAVDPGGGEGTGTLESKCSGINPIGSGNVSGVETIVTAHLSDTLTTNVGLENHQVALSEGTDGGTAMNDRGNKAAGAETGSGTLVTTMTMMLGLLLDPGKLDLLLWLRLVKLQLLILVLMVLGCFGIGGGEEGEEEGGEDCGFHSWVRSGVNHDENNTIVNKLGYQGNSGQQKNQGYSDLTRATPICGIIPGIIFIVDKGRRWDRSRRRAH